MGRWQSDGLLEFTKESAKCYIYLILVQVRSSLQPAFMSYRRLSLTNFRGFKLDPAFTAFSHDDGSSNSGLDSFVDS